MITAIGKKPNCYYQEISELQHYKLRGFFALGIERVLVPFLSVQQRSEALKSLTPIPFLSGLEERPYFFNYLKQILLYGK